MLSKNKHVKRRRGVASELKKNKECQNEYENNIK